MQSLPPVNELIGLAVAIASALAFVSYMLYAKARDNGMSARRAFGLLTEVWGLTFALLGLLFLTRAVVGTPLVEGSPSEGVLMTAHLTPASWGVIALTIVLVTIGGLRLHRVLRTLDPPPVKPSAPPDQTC